jgi:hypothetical protein
MVVPAPRTHAIVPAITCLRPFALYLRRLAHSLAGAGIEVLLWREVGKPFITIRPLPTERCHTCGQAWFRLSNYIERVRATWLCGRCNPYESNPDVWMNPTIKSTLLAGYWETPPTHSRRMAIGRSTSGGRWRRGARGRGQACMFHLDVFQTHLPLRHPLAAGVVVELARRAEHVHRHADGRIRGPGRTAVWSGRGDLNARPPAPKAGALPGCATPRLF